MEYNIKKLEYELDIKNTDNFIFEFHNNGIFNEEKFFKFIMSIFEFVENYPNIQQLSEEEYLEYVNSIIQNCEETLWMFVKHFMPEDNYIIKNFDEIKRNLTEYYMFVKGCCEKLILNKQEL